MALTTNWENTFKPYDWAQNITADRYKFVAPDDANTNERAQPTPDFARFIILLTGFYHSHRVLLPGVPSEHLLRAMRGYNEVDYWVVEEDWAVYSKLADNDDLQVGRPATQPRFLYNLETLWNQPFEDWVAEYDPEQSVVHTLIVNGPLYRASADMLDAWKYLRMNGQMFAFLPHNDFFRDDAEGEELREWAGEHELTYGVPAKGMLAPSETKIICLFGEKKDP